MHNLPQQVNLGDFVEIPEEMLDEKNHGHNVTYVARVVEIFFTVTGEWRVGIHWFYKACDTPLAYPVKEVKQPKGKKKNEEPEAPVYLVSCKG